MSVTVWVKSHIRNLAVIISGNKKWSFVISYFYHRKKLPNLNTPHNLSEILVKRVLDGEIDKLYYLADKLLMRDYVEEQGLSEYLPNLLGCYSSVEEIDFDHLPHRFALKMNFGAGMNIICSDKKNIDISSTKAKLEEWLNKKSTYSYAESHYNLIQRRIICEEFIDDGKGGFPVDYKFMCVKGEPICLLVCVDRDGNNERYLPYSLEWEYLSEWDNYANNNINTEIIERPQNFGEMLDIARKLSQDIPFVRVDLYSNGKQIWIGELTLTPDGCILHRWTEKALEAMGEYYRNH